MRQPTYALYEDVDPSVEGGPVIVRAGFTASPEDVAPDGVEKVELPRVELAATLVHHGVMARIGDSWMALMRWIDDEGYRPVGVPREVYLESEMGNEEDWVTELQVPVEKI